jgi:uncharacterized small protein (DUF1192 family)
MLNDDAPSPLTKSVQTLDMMSVEELEARIVALRAEIEACEKMAADKRRHRDAADSLFKSRPT